MDDQQIIGLYWKRSDEAIAQTQKKYGKLCYKIAYNILDSHQDCEECVNDTYLRAWNVIPPKRPQKLSAFLCRITRNQALKRYESNIAEKRGGVKYRWRWRNWQAVSRTALLLLPLRSNGS